MLRNKLQPRGGRRGLAGLLSALLLAALAALANWLWPQDHPQAPPARQAPAASAGGVPAGSYALTGPIVNVADGDTVTLRAPGGQRRIRMDSIDAPEEGHGNEQPGQPFAQASRQHLAGLVAGKTLTAQCYERDQFDRDVCALILPDGRSANRAQVEAGYAWAYTARRGDYLRDPAMPGLQRQAREAGRGLWAQSGAIEPWKWRYDCWRQRRC
ncbi:thermonuclease family protein [Bordetella bronchiseptica]|uniref:thermonuclease family protein n=1 Tax=Bordetella bronchiseptica TaxID=518 RepID=UPI00028ABE21|nr:thermonuclease family protein [Bordetella bronchiseptica]KDD54389.1 nuclease-like protein [Bordetella bronchiseptica OSU553]AUL14971.1 nuclease [Bordetella bronchiseptica]AWP58069.1 nuclease [Bordetella bronchiseptica]AWQ04801.1 nuclease [Bordetella bronchiseptica]KAK52142.1 nuclease-like protein [Bordetella bronchiseptica OSU054]